MDVFNKSIKLGEFGDKCKRKEKDEIKLLIKILALLSLFLLVFLIFIYTNKKLRKEISKIKVDLKNDEVIKDEYKKLKEILSKINYNKNLISISNNNSTLKSQYFNRFEYVFDKYRNKTELSAEYKNKFKQFLLNGFSSIFKRKYTKIDVIIFNKYANFGNAIFALNNLIYFCEILDCKKIYLAKYYWFIKKQIYDKELNITISPLNIATWDNQYTIDINPNIHISKLFRYNYIPVRTYILKNEIFSNLRLINTNIEDLYINIRSGKDIFKNLVPSSELYIQPPLCFYNYIIETFNFSNIYIISNGKENPVVNELLKSYKKIKYFHGTVKEDASLILSAKNLVLPSSSFSVELIKLSDNLKNLFEFNFILPANRRNWHFYDRHLRPLKFNRFIMNPTKEYLEIMNPWTKSKKQLSQMITEKCIKKFTLIPSDFT